MRVLIVTIAALLLVPNVVAAGDCCGDHKCAAAVACCRHESSSATIDPVTPSALTPITPGLEWHDGDAVRPTREQAVVFFRDPVKVGGKYLMGSYVIEHDLDRMARGLPCTHIYAADDRRLPVLAFHCRHLDRKTTAKATVTLRRLPDPSTRMFELVEYQFEGSGDGHGVPNGR